MNTYPDRDARRVRGRARRATCPTCGRSIAVSYLWEAGQWVLRPHVNDDKLRGVKAPCRGYRVPASALEPVGASRGEG